MTTVARRAFAKRLIAFRQAAGFDTAKEFAINIGVRPGTYGLWERAEAEPNIDHILVICHALQVTPTVLLSGGIVEKFDVLKAAESARKHKK